MSKLDELIAELCPDGVEFVPLGDCCSVEDNKRKPIKASDRIPGKTPYYGANNIQDYVDGFTHDGEYVLIAEDGSSSLKNYSVQYVCGKFWANNHVHVVKGNVDLNSRFLYHYLTSFNFVPYLVGGTRAKLNKAELLTLPIPLPPLPVQQEIVRILDNFTELKAELKAEIEARKKQYEYYRDWLLSQEELNKLCPDGVQYKSIGEVCDFRNGFAFKSSKFKDNGEPILRISNIQDEKIDTNNLAYFDLRDYAEDLSPYIVNKGDIVVAMSGATTGKIGINDTDNIYYLNQRVGKFIPNEEIILNKLLYHILTSKTDLIYQLSGGGAQPNLSSEKLKKIKIPVPPLPVQQKIVRILDNFTELIAQLETELEARQKQYEYYRDKLLSFKEATA